MDAIVDLLLAEAEHYAAGQAEILTPLRALRVRLTSADPTTDHECRACKRERRQRTGNG